MTQIPQGNPAARPDTRPLLTQLLRTFYGVYTRAARTAVPDGYFFNIENLIPIGDQNMIVVPNLSASLFNYSTDTIYWAQNANLNGTEYLVLFSTTGKVFLWNIQAQTSVQINVGTPLSGSNSRMAQWANSQLLFIDSTGYYNYNGTTFTLITGTGVPSSGSLIAVYANRVWITQGRLLLCSGAGDFSATSWTVANGAGSFNLTDPSLRTSPAQAVVANGYLYLISSSGITAVSNVYVASGASPPTPNASINNLQALIGTDQPASVFPYDRNIMLASRYGIHELVGVDAPKISSNIDGTWKYVDFTQPISGGQVVVSNILCSAHLIKRLNDPIFGSNQIVVLWYSRAETNTNTGVQQDTDIFWFANYGALTLIVSGMVNNVPALFGFIGNQLFQLFADSTTAPNTAVWTKLYGMEDELARKQVMQAGIYADFTIVGSSLVLDVDTPTVSLPVNNNLTAIVTGAWVNLAGTQGQWQNNALTLGNWAGQTSALLSGDAPSMYNHYVGLRLTTTGYQYALHLMAMDYKLGDRWQ